MTGNEKKELFVQAWKSVFGVDSVNDDDNFFEVGGDSIKGVQLVGWLIQKGLKLDMLKIYTAPTVAELVEALEETQPMAVPAELLTKDNADRFMKDPVVQQAMANMGGMPPMQGGAPQMNYAPPMQGGTPQMNYAAPMQLCTPQMSYAAPMQLCTPQMNYASPMQLCTPQMNYAPPMQAGTQAPYMGFPTNAPIQNPNVIQVQEPKLGAVTKSPEDALNLVLSGIFPNGYNKQENLLTQGMNSFQIMQLITRCGEQGYRLRIEDVMKNPTFSGIVSSMKTE